MTKFNEEGILQNCDMCGKEEAYTFLVRADKDLIEYWCQTCIDEHDGYKSPILD